MRRHFSPQAAAVFACLFLLLTCVAPSVAAVLYVKADSPADGPGDTWATAYHTITNAITHSAAGGEVRVAAGTYHEHITLSSGLSLLGGYNGVDTTRDPKLNVTMVDGDNLANTSIIWIPNTATGTFLIDGFIIQRGKGYNGGAINCATTTGIVTISNNIIQNCTATSTGSYNNYGGAVYLLNASATVSNNIIRSNTASAKAGYFGYGGGICVVGSAPTIVNNIIDHNTCTGSGGGIYCNGGTPNIINNTIADNTTGAAGGGGGIAAVSSSPIITNNIVAYNSSGFLATGTGTWAETYNCLFSNPTFVGSKDYDGLAGSGTDVLSDPVLKDRTNKDYHILSTSACIDRGTNGAAIPAIDYDGLIRPEDGNGDQTVTADIGAYEFPLDIAKAKAFPTGTVVALGGQSVTAAFPTKVYVESADRTAAIRLDTAAAFAVGTVLNITGTVQTDAATGERYVASSAGWPKSIGTAAAITPIVQETIQMDKTGELLVTTTGVISQLGTGDIYVDDGYGLMDGTKTGTVFNTGIRVSCDSTGYSAGDLVQVTGICTSYKPSGSTQPVILARDGSDVTKLAPACPSLYAYKAADIGTVGSLTGLVVTASRVQMGGTFIYVEDQTRTSGIRVVTDSLVAPDTIINVAGTLSRAASGELQITSPRIIATTNQSPLKSIGIPTRYIGGGPLGQQYGISGAVGVNNMGLLVTVWGAVTYSEPGFFYVDDGSGLSDGSTHKGVKVYGSVPVAEGEDPVGKFVRVTGISSCELLDTNLIRAILTRGSGDVVTF